MVKNLIISADGNFFVNKSYYHSVISRLKKYLIFEINSLYINFVSKEYIQKINKKYLKHDFSTDIITFNYSGDNKILDGEVFISVDDAGENAKRFNCSTKDELLRLVIHGVLHLIGYNDKSADEIRVMRKMENTLLRKLLVK